MDELLPGLALGAVEVFWPAALRPVDDHPIVALVGVSLATVAAAAWAHAWWFVDGVGYSMAGTTFGYSALGLLFAAWVMVARGAWVPAVPGAEAVARWSYAIYLSHKAVAVVVAPVVAGSGPWGALIGVTAASLGVGFGLHHLVERPFLRLRERVAPSLFGGNIRLQ